jgi:hypothetical protein
VVSAADVADLAQKFSAFRLDLMPHFAAFFWAEDGMHSLIRGNMRALDAETGLVVAQGEGFHTWNEVGLQSVRKVRVDMDALGDEAVLALPLAVGVVLASSITIDSTEKVQLVLPTAAVAVVQANEPPAVEADVAEVPAEDVAVAPEDAYEAPAAFAPVVAAVAVLSEVEPIAEVAPPEPVVDDSEPVEDAPAEEEVAEHAEEAPDEGVVADPAEEAPAEEEVAEHAEEVPALDDEAPAPVDEAPAAFVAEPSLPIDSHEFDQPESVEEPEGARVDENLDDFEAAYKPSGPGPVEPEQDPWGVRSSEALTTVDLFVDEDGDGIPDAQQHGFDLDGTLAAAPVEPVALEVAAPEESQAEGFLDAPGADSVQDQGGFVAAPVPAPQGPPPGWNQAPQNPYGQQQPGLYGQPQRPDSTGMPFAAPGLSASQYPPPPSLPGQPFPGQAYPGQPYPGQPFPGQGQFGPYSAQQQPTYPATYPPSPQYGAPTSPSGAPLSSPLVSPVPPPRAYAPAAPPPQAPGAPSEPGLPVSGDSADSDGTVFSTGIAMTHKPAAPRSGSDNLILAVVCSFGHPNPPGSPRCRRCGQPVDNANPRLVHKPALAQLITAGGARVDVTGSVLIGRAPSAQAGDGNPILLPIPSPNSDISRTHLKVAVKDWDIVATDLHSTNGTMLVRPGQAPVRMMPGTPVTVEPGTILDLGDGGVITVGLPA